MLTVDLMKKSFYLILHIVSLPAPDILIIASSFAQQASVLAASRASSTLAARGYPSASISITLQDDTFTQKSALHAAHPCAWIVSVTETAAVTFKVAGIRSGDSAQLVSYRYATSFNADTHRQTSEVKMLTTRRAKVPRSEEGCAATPEGKDLSEMDQPNVLLPTTKLQAMPRSASGRRIAVLAEL
ncbi:hypothetical protein PMIN01_11961 [Paraphaeosphaeria minitans]|uniref:Uncharacterized protein n=1 Tax=Paraphaeosphaeria minitans TaxID=565426 RepID=A0A9P6KK28_9PLEO|nr:hypothetical protein PMIN01_11961 [Paraphaeosphaeria minitans]